MSIFKGTGLNQCGVRNSECGMDGKGKNSTVLAPNESEGSADYADCADSDSEGIGIREQGGTRSTRCARSGQALGRGGGILRISDLPAGRQVADCGLDGHDKRVVGRVNRPDFSVARAKEDVGSVDPTYALDGRGYGCPRKSPPLIAHSWCVPLWLVWVALSSFRWTSEIMVRMSRASCSFISHSILASWARGLRIVP